MACSMRCRLFLPEQGAVAALFRGGRSLAFKDMEGIAQLLIDAEMKMFSRLSTPVVFLQNIVTDLLLGLGAKDAFRFFADHVVRRYNAEPGFITMNLPRLLDTLEDVGIVDPIVCANINSAGFRMCGGTGTIRGNNRDAQVSSYSDVGARIGRTRAAGGHRLCVPTGEDSFDRIRRIHQGTHRGDQAPDRRIERRPSHSVRRRARRTWMRWDDERREMSGNKSAPDRPTILADDDAAPRQDRPPRNGFCRCRLRRSRALPGRPLGREASMRSAMPPLQCIETVYGRFRRLSRARRTGFYHSLRRSCGPAYFTSSTR